ncbi:30S ribosomal protein S17e [Candidatus Woesearchaeota archaeon CG_4_10_14_0_2_um_filter_33_10]|nr:MAG: 30S ribosomal protein S17e [Candidatus Woesearchaeota archaeon CG1_02_33_12]PIN78512.1 MAG: 30S ribosomal protein S17e [Candidatus Woesearchaeota archaeon CG10_big_fil_rev_8_21_14_0_10_33_12]PIZ52768.1 MAG: 30S ribosomal protein S17e [Candidatus Woesearchaeota archaeon CG_4_10_14_0_2_um_filter_33_10]
MGRIKTKLIKGATNKLVDRHRQEFKKNFEENKKLVSKFANISSTKIRNIIAGYVTRLMNTKKDI